MKTMAQLENGIVVNIVVEYDDVEDTETKITYTEENPAYIGGDYVDGSFYPPQPFPSWTRYEGVWVAPIARPDDGNNYLWDEDAQEWIAV
jgi:hypothetical protein